MEENKNMTENQLNQDLVANDMPPELKVAGNQRRDTEARWYVLHTFNGYETVAEDNLKKVIENIIWKTAFWKFLFRLKIL